MNSQSLTLVLIVLILLALAWTSGRLQRVLNAVFK